MSPNPTFEWWPVDQILVHERCDALRVDMVMRQMRRMGVCEAPLWVDRSTHVLLDGHHRLAALRQLGAKRVPVWVFDYQDDSVISLGRWSAGPAIGREEVVRRARAGELYPPKTTRHTVHVTLPAHPVPLSEALAAPSAAGATPG